MVCEHFEATLNLISYRFKTALKRLYNVESTSADCLVRFCLVRFKSNSEGLNSMLKVLFREGINWYWQERTKMRVLSGFNYPRTGRTLKKTILHREVGKFTVWRISVSTTFQISESNGLMKTFAVPE